MERISGTLHEDRYKFLTVSHPFLLRMRNVADKSCTENQNTQFGFKIFFYRAVYEIGGKIEPDRPQMTI